MNHLSISSLPKCALFNFQICLRRGLKILTVHQTTIFCKFENEFSSFNIHVVRTTLCDVVIDGFSRADGMDAIIKISVPREKLDGMEWMVTIANLANDRETP